MQDWRLSCCSSALSLYLEYSARALDKRCPHAERDELRDCSLNRNGIYHCALRPGGRGSIGAEPADCHPMQEDDIRQAAIIIA